MNNTVPQIDHQYANQKVDPVPPPHNLHLQSSWSCPPPPSRCPCGLPYCGMCFFCIMLHFIAFSCQYSLHHMCMLFFFSFIGKLIWKLFYAMRYRTVWKDIVPFTFLNEVVCLHFLFVLMTSHQSSQCVQVVDLLPERCHQPITMYSSHVFLTSKCNNFAHSGNFVNFFFTF
jgi:hypothetical protein